MSQNYLNKFRSKLPTAQGRQILKILTARRNRGEIRTIDEFKDRLKELTNQLLEDKLKPTLKMFWALGGTDINSEQYNEMLALIENDLLAGFEEADNLDEIIASHHNLIKDVSLKSLRYGLNQLQAQVSLYEFLVKNSDGFDDALYNTFNASEDLTTSRSQDDAALVYVDPRLSETIGSAEDATVDLVGERLILGPTKQSYVDIRKAAWLSNSNSIRSELDASFPDSNINHIIDNTKNTFWVVPILQREIHSSGVSLEVQLSLPISQDINFVDIEPACDAPMVLTEISYLSANNTRIDLGQEDVEIKGTVRVNFPRITARELILRFRQDNYKEVQFVEKKDSSNFRKVLADEKGVEIDVLAVSEDLQAVLSSDFILSDAFGTKSVLGHLKKFYQYTLGFDNIKTGLYLYTDRSIFISNKKEVKHLGLVGLKTTETRPTQPAGSSSISNQSYTYPARSGDNDNIFYYGSIEYWIAAQNYSKEGYLISTDIYPILPLGANRIYHERLLLTHKSSEIISSCDRGILMFYTLEDGNNTILYRNGTMLEYGTDWSFVSSATDTDITLDTPNSGARMKRGVQITGTVNPLDIYTATYSPVVSNSMVIPSDTTLFDIVDLAGDQSVRVARNNLLVFDETRYSYSIENTNIYLIVIFRRNSAIDTVSPAVEDYMLVTGTRDKYQ